MLVLTRKEGEDIVITSPTGEHIYIRVWLDGNKVSVALDAPSTYSILRRELLNKPRKKK